jgi:hypothetical protein
VVNRSLSCASNHINWSQDSDSYKVIFLVGDAPPHRDYQDEKQYPQLIKEAQQKGILINTIQCGSDSNTRQHWQNIASLAQGDFFQVEQNGGSIAIKTPFDQQIADLSRQLDETRLSYGDAEAHKEFENKKAATEKLYDKASIASLARRGLFNASEAGTANRSGEDDLITQFKSGALNVETLEEEKLPAPLVSKPKAEQIRIIESTAKQRDELMESIKELSTKRKEFISTEMKKVKNKTDSLDYQILGTLKKQIREKGIEYVEEEPEI